MSARIALVVHGRFYAFDLARELWRQGSDVTLYTNYPRWAAARFGVPRQITISNVPHAALARGMHKLGTMARRTLCEAYVHRSFGRWAAKQIALRPFDVVFCFSSVAEELFSHPACADSLKLLARASAHIATQRRLLDEEEHRADVRIEKPSEWMMEREAREYALADRIVVPSTFALDSFVENGIAADRLCLLPLGVEVSRFRCRPEIAAARMKRVQGGERLRVLTTGLFSAQKGAHDYAEVVERTHREIEYRWVGAVPPESEMLKARLRGKVSFIAKVPQYELAAHYEWADVFLFPTIQDGFPVVLAQAQAAGLPLVATSNSSASDIIVPGRTGWTLPIRAPEALARRMQWCNANREALARVVQRSYESHVPRDWSEVAAHFLRLLENVAKKSAVT